MSEIFYLRDVDPPVSAQALPAMLENAGDCLNLHRVEWKISYLAQDGGRLLCWYQAPDTESARIALRSLGSDMNAIWPGKIITLGTPSGYDLTDCNTFLKLNLPNNTEPERVVHTLRELIASSDSMAFAHSVELPGGRGMLCLLHANSPAAVRSQFEVAGLQLAECWPCSAFIP